MNFKKIDIKNHVCFYFDYTMRVFDINARNILLDEKKYENILIYDIYDIYNFYDFNTIAY